MYYALFPSAYAIAGANLSNVAAAIQVSLAVVVDLSISGVTMSDQGPVLRFHTFAGQQYSVECSTSLSPGDWSALPGGSIMGDGTDVSWTDTSPAASSPRFYRLSLPRAFGLLLALAADPVLLARQPGRLALAPQSRAGVSPALRGSGGQARRLPYVGDCGSVARIWGLTREADLPSSAG